jgi:hypothetical protein
LVRAWLDVMLNGGTVYVVPEGEMPDRARRSLHSF